MTFKAHSDASYLSRSRIGGVLFLDNPCQKNDFVYAAVDPFSTTNLNVVFASAVEAEFAAVFTVAQETEPLQVTHSLNSDIPNNHLNNQTMLSVDKVIVKSSMSFKCAGFFAVLQAQMNESNELALVRQIALVIDCQLKTIICLQYVSTKTRQTLLRRHSTVDVDEAKTSKNPFFSTI